MHPFLVFHVLDQNNKNRILEINFLHQVVIDNYKDHVKRAYNFAIIKDVTRDFSSNKFFLHFFTSEKPLPYVSAYECQRDFTVDAILLAISQAR